MASARLACAALALLLGVVPLSAAAGVLEAADSGDLDAVRRSVAAGESLDVRDSRGWSPLMVAAVRGNVDIVRVLLEAGADANSRAREGSTPLIGAAVSGHFPVVQLLLERGADPSLTNDSGATAEVKAQQYGFLDIAKYIGRAAATRAVAPKPPEPVDPIGPAFDVEDLQEVYVLVEDAIFRKLPSLGAPAAGQLPMGVVIRVTGKVRGRDWYRVGPASASVYVPAQAIKPQSALPSAPPKAQNPEPVPQN